MTTDRAPESPDPAGGGEEASSAHPRRIAFLGAGNMGGAVVDGLTGAGLPVDRVVITAASEATRSRWQERGFEVTADNREAAEGADVVVLGVKPYLVAEVLQEIAPVLEPDVLVLSLAAGITLAALEQHAGPDVPVARVLPNTPVGLGRGVFVVTGGTHCTDDHLTRIASLFDGCGHTEVVPESGQNAASALSGSGPAYVFFIAEALIEAGVFEGLPRPVAARLVARTLDGAAAMLEGGAQTPTTLREQVTSPGGTTMAALRQLEAGAVRYHLGAAVSAAVRRSAELGS